MLWRMNISAMSIMSHISAVIPKRARCHFSGLEIMRASQRDKLAPASMPFMILMPARMRSPDLWKLPCMFWKTMKSSVAAIVSLLSMPWTSRCDRRLCNAIVLCSSAARRCRLQGDG
ncbi:hypothetical protein Micbo1qcDRAFT_160251, partial [Microdochium bolleyi]